MTYILIILLAIVFSAFFSGMEKAFISSNKLRLELDKKQGVFSSEIIKIFTQNPGQYLATMLIGNSIALVIFGLSFSRFFSPLLSTWLQSDILILMVNTVLSIAVILLITGFLPGTVFILDPNFFLKAFSVPALFFLWILFPVSGAMTKISAWFVKLVSGSNTAVKINEETVFLKTDIGQFIALHNTSREEIRPEQHNIRIFKNALDFSNVRLKECMVPRTEIQAIEVMSGVEQLKEKFIETQHSRILVYEETIDNIAGYFDIKDIYSNPPDIRSGIRKLAIVPETMPANKLLKVFVEEKKNIALVVDEFGGTAGIVTIEDVLEEIVGDIEDEHDTSELTEKLVSANEYIFSGRLEIDYLNEKYNLGLPEEDDYETLAGLILFYHGSIPGSNDVIRIGKMVFRILKVTNTRVELISIKTE